MTTRSIDSNTFRLEPVPCLIGGRHRVSGRLAFPLPPDPEQYEAVDFPSVGTLWSYTVQRIVPKSPPYRGPDPFQPFAVGYVELAGALIVESRLCGVDFTHLKIGQPLQLTSIPLYRDHDGVDVLSFAFTRRAEHSS